MLSLFAFSPRPPLASFQKLTEKVDIYSLAMVYYCMLALDPPYKGVPGANAMITNGVPPPVDPHWHGGFVEVRQADVTVIWKGYYRGVPCKPPGGRLKLVHGEKTTRGVLKGSGGWGIFRSKELPYPGATGPPGARSEYRTVVYRHVQGVELNVWCGLRFYASSVRLLRAFGNCTWDGQQYRIVRVLVNPPDRLSKLDYSTQEERQRRERWGWKDVVHNCPESCRLVLAVSSLRK